MDVVGVGTGNPVKILAVKRAWRLKSDARVESVPVDSGVPAQPIGVGETVRGAVNRAQAVLEKGGFDYGVGIEAGLIPFPSSSGYMDVQVAVIVGPGSRASIGFSPGFEMPEPWVQRILGGLELEEVAVKEFSVRNIGDRMGVIGRLTEGRVTRLELTYMAVLMALLPWINPEIYGGLISAEELARLAESQIF